MAKRMFLMLAIFFGVVALLVVITVFRIKAAASRGKMFAPPPAAVSTVIVQAQTWQPYVSAVGSLEAVNGVTVSTDQSGVVVNIPFESGTPVKKGDLLMELDAKQDVAQLHSAEAQRDWMSVSLARQADLLKRKVAAQSDYDQAKAQYDQAVAAVEQIEAVIDHKTVRAPFDGMAGIRQVNKGQYFSAGTPIVSLQSFSPIYVNFSLPQQSLKLVNVGSDVALAVDGFANDKFQGKVTALNSAFDTATRNIEVQATLENADGRLKPGMFAKVQVLIPSHEDVLAVPTSSINYAPYGNSVFIVKSMKGEDGASYQGVEEQFVQTGQSRGDQVQVTSGLKAGDVVVSAGVFRLKAGAAVQVNNQVQPENKLNPTPPNT
ncbi:MAG: efflux RND transporter periplasmic adaptor subunit [Chthoniobacteraceae bacterium]